MGCSRGGGAERLEGTLTLVLVVSMFASRWSADGIKLFSWLSLKYDYYEKIVSYLNFAIE